MKNHINILIHLLMLLVVVIWGSTFVYTKILLLNGISAAQIFMLRFALAYITLFVYSLLSKHHKWFSSILKDELKMLLLGISGGSLYFFTENSAMNYTTATNTSLIVCACPLFTTLIVALFYKSEHIGKVQVIGSLVAALGMAVVVLNGHFVLELSPKGDLLAFTACMSWVVYSLLMMDLGKRYSPLFTTRKVFFYGLLTIIPYFLINPEMPSLGLLVRGDILLNLLYLSVVASTLSFLLWNWAIKRIGMVVTTNYVYLNPVATILFAWWIIDEPITPWLIIGSALLLFGLLLVNRKLRLNETLEQ